MRQILSLFLLICLVAIAQPADIWPAFRGPNGDGTSESKNVPTRWSETQNIRWKTAIHGKGWSSPVVWGDQIWMTTADEIRSEAKDSSPKSGGAKSKNAGAKGVVERVMFFAVGVDRESGKITHDITLSAEKNPAFCIDFNSYASPTPVIEEGRLYAHFGSHGTWCVDTKTGKVIWERRDLKCDHYRGAGSSPIVYKNLLIMIFDGFDQQYVVAVDKSTGATVWKKDRNIKYSTDNGDYKKAYATARVIEVNGRAELICPSAECTIAHDPMTGEELWRFHHLKKGTMNVAARPLGAHGLIYLVSGHPAQLMALKEGVLGSVSKSDVVWETDKGVPTRPSLLVKDDLLFMVNDGGVVTCLDAKKGKMIWSERLNGEFTASPILVNDCIYLPNQTGKTTVIKASREYQPVATNELDAGCMASPAIAGITLLLRTKTHLYSIEKK